MCADTTFFLSKVTWIRLVIWTAIGEAIYVCYGFKHSKLKAPNSIALPRRGWW